MKTASNSWDVKGAWSYMAPEQFSDFRKTRSQADIYSLGKILYEAIQGKIEANQIPFTTVSLRAPRTILLNKLDIVIKNATHEIASRRYQNINEMRKAINSALQTKYDEPLKKAKLFPSSKLFWWLLGVISIPIISVAVMTIYHLFD
jgi:serine/threonine-protein kinase